LDGLVLTDFECGGCGAWLYWALVAGWVGVRCAGAGAVDAGVDSRDDLVGEHEAFCHDAPSSCARSLIAGSVSFVRMRRGAPGARCSSIMVCRKAKPPIPARKNCNASSADRKECNVVDAGHEFRLLHI